VIVDYLFYVSHDLSIAALGYSRHLVNRLGVRFEDSSGLRMQDKRNGQEPLEDA
jgi:hypothetical protein